MSDEADEAAEAKMTMPDSGADHAARAEQAREPMPAMRPPEAARVPHARTVHGDTFEDPYEWMRDKDSREVREFVDAQNRYCEAATAGQRTLRATLFDELRSRVRQTDMSVPTRMDGYWYFARTIEGRQYAVQCRIPVSDADDWTPPVIDANALPGSMGGEQVVFDANRESQGHDFFRVGGMDLSRDGRWLLYGVDTRGDERYDFRIRDLATGDELPEVFPAAASAMLTPDGGWVFGVELDDAWRPCAVWRHKVGTPVEQDVEVFRERDERFWVGVGMSFDERSIVIVTGSKTSSEVWMLPADDPEGRFQVIIPRADDVEYDVSFARFEADDSDTGTGIGEGSGVGDGADGDDSDTGEIPIAVVYHNANNPNFEIDVIDMRRATPPFRLGDGVRVAVGSPYGCEHGDEVIPGASSMPVATAFTASCNPRILHGARGLAIEGIAMHRHFVTLSYRADGLPHVAVMPKRQARQDFLAGRPWRFVELKPPALAGDWDVDAAKSEPVPSVESEPAGVESAAASVESEPAVSASFVSSPSPSSSSPSLSSTSALDDGRDGSRDGRLDGRDGRLYAISAGGDPSYDAPRIRYSFASYARPGELHEYDPATGSDVLLKRAEVLGGFDPRRYMERRVWVTARDGERIPVSLVWRRDYPLAGRPMFITGYGAYEISSDPGFAVSRISMLDRGVLYAVPHVRGGGEMGRAWYEQGRRLNKRHTFEDFVDATIALQDAGFADVNATVANGGSAGGLLMGAVANMAPGRYAGIEADVPFVDALTSILDPSLPLTVTEWDEWGDPLHDERVYRYMKSYTPYENAPSTPDDPRVCVFPKILVTTSMNDTRVLVVEPLKWVARLQSAGIDAVAKIEVEAGHGGTSGRYRQWEEVSYENAWCLTAMGITK